MELGAAFILGFLGSLHCAGMCGPLMVALPIGNGSRSSFVFGRYIYQSGRLGTYSLIGLVFGLAGKSLFLIGVQRWVSIAIGVLLILGLFFSRKLSASQPVGLAVGFLRKHMGRLLREKTTYSLALLGALNGLLPCGLVYIAGAGALATGGVFSGVLYMLAFGLGTAPMMLGLSLSGSLLPATWRLRLVKIIPVSIFLLGSLLILRGMELGIPYVSPQLSGHTPACCHP
jgi:uncharacterized protein